jgi:hypothetical protein
MVKNPKVGFEFDRAVANMDADRPCLETRRFWKGGGGSSAGHGPALSVSPAFLYQRAIGCLSIDGCWDLS